MGTPTFEHIDYDISEGVARITLNRPEKLNAISNQMLRELHDALWDADDDTSVHCAIIRGAGRAFCAGYDLAGPPHGDGRARVNGPELRDENGYLIDP